MGLSADEFKRVCEILGRIPNVTELGLFSAMWSEHCSYKSSRIWLRTLPTEAPWVICGPGENAGVIDIGDGRAAIFKMESHNHPSYIEPYQGAATGVGGILRDVFTMGARPVANLNCLRFGRPDHPRSRHLVAGVVAGIGGYGNCIGVPTVGGEVSFDSRYDGNILVNAMTVGIADSDRIFYAKATGVGSPVVYVGSKTGRDGIHGATMASAAFAEDSEEKRPTVQVGDPFTEKLLLEACLELMATDAIIGIQDMGAAGLTSSSIEMAAKGEGGIVLNLDRVPVREDGMSPYEIMLSESQERMLMVLRPGQEETARRIFEKWGLDVSVIGSVTDTGRMVLRVGDEVVADAPIEPLAEGVRYERPWQRPQTPRPLPDLLAAEPLVALEGMLAGPDLCGRRWVWEQYDHMVMADTVQRPGGDAAVVRVHGTKKGLAIATDCTPRYCEADPELGGAQAVAECWRNLTAVGARPLAITDCLNFGNPERPHVMGQFVLALRGMKEACKALDFPVISGNVSFYNETEGRNIPPTPQIGGVGLLDDVSGMVDLAVRQTGDSLIMIGRDGAHLGQSLYARHLICEDLGTPPNLNLDDERRYGDFVRALIGAGRVSACHDISDGGLLVAAAEMAMAGDIGLAFDTEFDIGQLFGEDQARYLVAAAPDSADAIIRDALCAGLTVKRIATAGGDALTLPGAGAISVADLRAAHERWFPAYMARA